MHPEQGPCGQVPSRTDTALAWVSKQTFLRLSLGDTKQHVTELSVPQALDVSGEPENESNWKASTNGKNMGLWPEEITWGH